MDICKDCNSAMDRAIGRFYRQVSDEPLYIYRASIERRPFFIVFSKNELKTYRLPLQKAAMVIGDSDSLRDSKRRLQAHDLDKRTRLQIKAIKGMHQYYQAQDALEKLKRGGDESAEDAQCVVAESK
ncbi:hypothetical protein [Anaeromusa acidaminophila]|uniref:hypothetical protein n=1 Tax=Anaeromusa acidaminophila TaxID=81464 RepID=UPI00036784E1|nr:hypothetical protein [Anaeromusa acidaminophila]